jgi:hypothetical protein
MEKVVRDHSDHLYPSYNTHIPDSPLPEDPGRFKRFSRFQQVFEAQYVDRASDRCMLPSYVASIFKTVDLIFGLPPLNQYDAAATDLREISDTPDFTPYDFTPVVFAAPNPSWRALTSSIDFARPDANEVELQKAILVSERLPKNEVRR